MGNSASSRSLQKATAGAYRGASTFGRQISVVGLVFALLIGVPTLIAAIVVLVQAHRKVTIATATCTSPFPGTDDYTCNVTLTNGQKRTITFTTELKPGDRLPANISPLLGDVIGVALLVLAALFIVWPIANYFLAKKSKPYAAAEGAWSVGSLAKSLL